MEKIFAQYYGSHLVPEYLFTFQWIEWYPLTFAYGTFVTYSSLPECLVSFIRSFVRLSLLCRTLWFHMNLTNEWCTWPQPPEGSSMLANYTPYEYVRYVIFLSYKQISEWSLKFETRLPDGFNDVAKSKEFALVESFRTMIVHCVFEGKIKNMEVKMQFL